MIKLKLALQCPTISSYSIKYLNKIINKKNK